MRKFQLTVEKYKSVTDTYEVEVILTEKQMEELNNEEIEELAYELAAEAIWDDCDGGNISFTDVEYDTYVETDDIDFTHMEEVECPDEKPLTTSEVNKELDIVLVC